MNLKFWIFKETTSSTEMGYNIIIVTIATCFAKIKIFHSPVIEVMQTDFRLNGNIFTIRRYIMVNVFRSRAVLYPVSGDGGLRDWIRNSQTEYERSWRYVLCMYSIQLDTIRTVVPEARTRFWCCRKLRPKNLGFDQKFTNTRWLDGRRAAEVETTAGFLKAS